MKHTRGPWIQDGRTVYALNDHGSNAMCCGLMPGNVQAGFDDEETQIANARLIAAAPEMYDLLVCAAAELRAWPCGSTGWKLADTINALLKRVEG